MFFLIPPPPQGTSLVTSEVLEVLGGDVSRLSTEGGFCGLEDIPIFGLSSITSLMVDSVDVASD